jgi:hypothetical protein
MVMANDFGLAICQLPFADLYPRFSALIRG